MEKEVLPYIRDRAVILNWSERRHWKNSLAVLAFQYFGGHKNFNPLGMVFRPFHSAQIYRFYEAFIKFKQGDVQKVENVRRNFLDDIHASIR